MIERQRIETSKPYLDGTVTRVQIGRKVRWHARRSSHGGERVSGFLRDEKTAKKWVESDSLTRITI